MLRTTPESEAGLLRKKSPQVRKDLGSYLGAELVSCCPVTGPFQSVSALWVPSGGSLICSWWQSPLQLTAHSLPFSQAPVPAHCWTGGMGLRQRHSSLHPVDWKQGSCCLLGSPQPRMPAALVLTQRPLSISLPRLPLWPDRPPVFLPPSPMMTLLIKGPADYR